MQLIIKRYKNKASFTFTDLADHCWRVSESSKDKLECGPMPNVMVALPNIGGALCSTPQSLPDANY